MAANRISDLIRLAGVNEVGEEDDFPGNSIQGVNEDVGQVSHLQVLCKERTTIEGILKGRGGDEEMRNTEYSCFTIYSSVSR